MYETETILVIGLGLFAADMLKTYTMIVSSKKFDFCHAVPDETKRK